MASPRAITGSPGSRIRVILGDHGSSWLLLLNEDNGNSKQQKQLWKSIPSSVERQIRNCVNKGREIKQVDFGESGSWFMNGQKPDGSGDHSWWNISCPGCSATVNEDLDRGTPLQVSLGSNSNFESCTIIRGSNGYYSANVHRDLLKRVKRINNRNKAIDFIRQFDFNGGGYFISDDEGTEWMNLGVSCGKELKRAWDVHDVAVAGDGSWVIVTGESFISSTGVDKQLVQHLNRFYRDHREWKNKRDNEIREYNERIAKETREAEQRARAEREAAERDQREQAEREERERVEREERERVEREERERMEREERGRVEREAQERNEREARERAEREAQVSREAALESMLEEHFLQEALGIREQEQHIREQDRRLQTRKRALQNSMDQIPEARRVRIEQNLNSPNRSTTPSTVTDTSPGPCCVVCQDNQAVRAVIPCGHHCLCDSCAATLVSQPAADQMCPLCRATLQQTLRVYSNN